MPSYTIFFFKVKSFFEVTVEKLCGACGLLLLCNFKGNYTIFPFELNRTLTLQKNILQAFHEMLQLQNEFLLMLDEK